MQANQHFNCPAPTQLAWLMPARLAIMAALTAALAACGGGGGGDSDTTASGSGSQTTSGGGYMVATVAGGRDNPDRAIINGPAATATFNAPSGVALAPDGSLYVADSESQRIRKIAPNGTVSTVAGGGALSHTGICDFNSYDDGPCASANFNGPQDLTVDKDGTIYVADTYNWAIRKITNPGTASCMVSTLAGSCNYGSDDGQGSDASFTAPMALAQDANGNLYVTDYYAVRKVTPSGLVTTLAGSNNSEPGTADGMGLSARFNVLQGIALDAKGNLYVSDFWNNNIRKIAPDGMVTTWAGTGAVGSANGPIASATFNQPAGLAIQADGTLYVSDHSSGLVRKITPNGQVTTLAGTGGWALVDGPASQAMFFEPMGLAVGAGVLYVADQGNNAIRKITLAP